MCQATQGTEDGLIDSSWYCSGGMCAERSPESVRRLQIRRYVTKSQLTAAVKVHGCPIEMGVHGVLGRQSIIAERSTCTAYLTDVGPQRILHATTLVCLAKKLSTQSP
jgi:hypothetical protein